MNRLNGAGGSGLLEDFARCEAPRAECVVKNRRIQAYARAFYVGEMNDRGLPDLRAASVILRGSPIVFRRVLFCLSSSEAGHIDSPACGSVYAPKS